MTEPCRYVAVVGRMDGQGDLLSRGTAGGEAGPLARRSRHHP
ncbi:MULTISPECIES: hypothetical protein [unclassified Methanoculleus]|nr:MULTISPECIES: hypothetical protein [unclassified Methanoculleus]